MTFGFQNFELEKRKLLLNLSKTDLKFINNINNVKNNDSPESVPESELGQELGEDGKDEADA